jgi:outer membrane protein OmpA-like peptidoglycan-associated protein
MLRDLTTICKALYFIVKLDRMKKIIFIILPVFFIQTYLCAQNAQPEKQFGQKTVLLSGKVLFDTAKSEIKEEFFASLNEMAGLLKAFPKNKIIIEGHTDREGGIIINKKLSMDRANSVKDFFTSAGVSPEIIEILGYGDEKPLASNEAEDGKRKNRRVEILILKLE